MRCGVEGSFWLDIFFGIVLGVVLTLVLGWRSISGNKEIKKSWKFGIEVVDCGLEQTEPEKREGVEQDIQRIMVMKKVHLEQISLEIYIHREQRNETHSVDIRHQFGTSRQDGDVL
jgi:hypothetical protein